MALSVSSSKVLGKSGLWIGAVPCEAEAGRLYAEAMGAAEAEEERGEA